MECGAAKGAHKRRQPHRPLRQGPSGKEPNPGKFAIPPRSHPPRRQRRTEDGREGRVETQRAQRGTEGGGGRRGEGDGVWWAGLARWRRVSLAVGARVGCWRTTTLSARTTTLLVSRKTLLTSTTTLLGSTTTLLTSTKTVLTSTRVAPRRTEGVLRGLFGFRHAGRMGMGRKNRSGSVPEGVRRGGGGWRAWIGCVNGGGGVGVAMIDVLWRVFGITSRPPSPHVRSGCRSRPTGSGWRRSGCWGS